MGLFGMSDKARQKLVTKSAEVSGSPQTDVVAGQRKFAMTSGAWIFGAIMAVILVALAIVLKIIPIPGILFVVLFMSITKPRRILAFGPGGYTNFKGSAWSTGPKEVLHRAPTVQFLNGNEVSIGAETITLTKKEMEYLQQRMSSGMAPAASPPPPGGPPFQASALAGHDQSPFPNSPANQAPQDLHRLGQSPQQLPPEPFQR